MSAHIVEGYVLCAGCGDELVLDVVANRTGDLCVDCLKANGGPRRKIEVLARGTRIPVPLKAPKRQKKRSAPSDESKAREKQVEKCRAKARKRLQALFPDFYDILLAEERAAAGFDPWPLSRAVMFGPDPDGSQTEAFLAVYHALDDRGVDV